MYQQAPPLSSPTGLQAHIRTHDRAAWSAEPQTLEQIQGSLLSPTSAAEQQHHAGSGHLSLSLHPQGHLRATLHSGRQPSEHHVQACSSEIPGMTSLGTRPLPHPRTATLNPCNPETLNPEP